MLCKATVPVLAFTPLVAMTGALSTLPSPLPAHYVLVMAAFFLGLLAVGVAAIGIRKETTWGRWLLLGGIGLLVVMAVAALMRTETTHFAMLALGPLLLAVCTAAIAHMDPRELSTTIKPLPWTRDRWW